MKICSKCETDKEDVEFSKNSGRSDGLQAWCKACSSARRTEWGRENPDKIQKNARYSNYRIHPEEYAKLWEKQNGICALCPTDLSLKTPDIDHDHATGEVRGLLCHRCNTLVGWYESIVDHKKIIQYLSQIPTDDPS